MSATPELHTIKRDAGSDGKLTKEQIQIYDTEGFLVLPDLLTPEDLAPCEKAMSDRVDQIAEQLLGDGLVTDAKKGEPFKYRLARLFDGLSDKDFLKYGRSWRDRHPGYFALMSNRKILDIVESLIGGEIFANPVYNTRPKVPRVAAGAVPWHQDKSYWPDSNANPVITVWIPLIDSTPENGCLHVWPRTHKTRLMTYHAEQTTGTGYLEIDSEHIGKLKREAVSLPVPAGSAIIFNDRCVHMSTANNSDHVRWSVDLRYQSTSQDRMPQHGAGFLARSRSAPERIATLADWMAGRAERDA